MNYLLGFVHERLCGENKGLFAPKEGALYREFVKSETVKFQKSRHCRTNWQKNIYRALVHVHDLIA